MVVENALLRDVKGIYIYVRTQISFNSLLLTPRLPVEFPAKITFSLSRGQLRGDWREDRRR